MTVMAKTTKGSAGCGCNQAAGGCGGSGCTCGTTSSASCPPGAMTRPQFFAGQLLTQEDLQLIVDYVVGTNRLRNRFLFGEGVVCGLTVTCPPCGGGSVVVNAGYAIDCCGNDIHLACRQELDINALVRELSLRTLDGWDCGDPCKNKGCSDKQETKEAAPATPAKEKVSRVQAQTPAAALTTTTSSARHYCLYIKYEETNSEPVAPYLSDGGCGGVACQMSRICEGYSFELRCVPKASPADIWDRVKACIGDPQLALSAVKSAYRGHLDREELHYGMASINANPKGLSEGEQKVMVAARQRLKAIATEKKKALEESETRRLLIDYQTLVVGMARLMSSDAKDAPSDTRQLDETLVETRKVLNDVGPKLRTLASGLTDSAERLAGSELVELGLKYAEATKINQDAFEFKLLSVGVPRTPKMLDYAQYDNVKLKRFLQERLEHSTALTNCRLLERLVKVRIDDADGLTAQRAGQVSDNSRELAQILLEYVRDCVCLAFNPQCVTCDDPAVLLACLDVEDCRVTEICNMARTFVLSPANLRYWLPPVGLLGNGLERLCCAFEFKLRGDRPATEDSDSGQRDEGFYKVRPLNQPASFLAAHLEAPRVPLEARQWIQQLGLAPSDVDQASELVVQFGALALAAAPEVAGLSREAVAGLGQVRPSVSSTSAGDTKTDDETLSDEALAERIVAVPAIAKLLDQNKTLLSEIARLSSLVPDPNPKKGRNQ
jgi:hypothetical protein